MDLYSEVILCCSFRNVSISLYTTLPSDDTEYEKISKCKYQSKQIYVIGLYF